MTYFNIMQKYTLLLFAALLLRTTLPAQCWQKINAGAMQVGDLQTIRIASKMLASIRVLGSKTLSERRLIKPLASSLK